MDMDITHSITPILRINRHVNVSVYLLKVGPFNILLDCGWTEEFLEDDLQPLVELFDNEEIHLIVISQNDIYHFGALVYLYRLNKINCPILSTDLIHRMGSVIMYEYYLNKCDVEEFNLFDLNDIDKVFNEFIAVNFYEMIHLTFDYDGIFDLQPMLSEDIHNVDQIESYLTFSPNRSGYTLGGSIWKISINNITYSDIIYISKASYYDETCLKSIDTTNIRRASLVLYGDSIKDDKEKLIKPEERNKRFKNYIEKSGKQVILLPLPLSAIFEFLFVVDKVNLDNFEIYWVSYVSRAMLELAKISLHWFGDHLLEKFSDNLKVAKNEKIATSNPFYFKKIKHVLGFENLPDLSSNSSSIRRLIITTPGTLHFPSLMRNFFYKNIISKQKNALLTFRWFKDKTLQDLIDLQSKEQSKRAIDFKIVKKVQLSGEDLEIFKKERDTEKEVLDRNNIDEERKNKEKVNVEKRLLLDTTYRHKYKVDFFDDADFQESTVNLTNSSDIIVTGQDLFGNIDNIVKLINSREQKSDQETQMNKTAQKRVKKKTKEMERALDMIDKEIPFDIKEEVKTKQKFNSEIVTLDWLRLYTKEQQEIIVKSLFPNETIDLMELECTKTFTIDQRLQKVELQKFIKQNTISDDGSIQIEKFEDELNERILSSSILYNLPKSNASQGGDYANMTSVSVKMQNGVLMKNPQVIPRERIIVGEVKQHILRDELTKKNIQSEPTEGKLVIQGGVEVLFLKKNSKTLIKLQGTIGKNYFIVKKILKDKLQWI
eukprot:TRINITY_DN2702_c0_g1_i1.p1 TRINITY_DN2702_c0_g1~~TRINITY_DN2702_c0_g1_i1.p1  ORF type:complete len:772 (+),score=208.15 TRINITY_DN2702_c0_g1_i1:49-2364(+)